MDDEHHKNPLPAPPGWKSPSQLRREGKGDMYVLTRELESLRDALILAKQDEVGMPEADARSMVEDLMIGRRRPPLGGKPSLYASPEAWEMVFDRLPPPAAQGWRPYTQLDRDGYKAGHHQILRKLEAFRNELVGDLTASGYGDKEAAALVDEHLIGRRRPHGGVGGSALYASRDAVEMMEREGLLKKRTQGERRSAPIAQTSDPNARLLLEATRRLELKGAGESAKKFYDLIVQEFPGTCEARQAAMGTGRDAPTPSI